MRVVIEDLQRNLRCWGEFVPDAQAGRRGRRRAGEVLTGSSEPHRPLPNQGLPAPDEEMVPSKEPVVVPAILSNRRSHTKPPVAPSNRPVPPTIVAVSTM